MYFYKYFFILLKWYLKYTNQIKQNIEQRKYCVCLDYSTISCKLRKAISISKDQLFAGEYTNEFRSKVFCLHVKLHVIAY